MKMKNFTQFNLQAYRILFLSLFVSFSLHTNAQTSKEYTEADVASFATDLSDGTYDTYILSTSGGVYDIDYVRIYSSVVIKGKEGLDEKPILKNTATTSSSSASTTAISNTQPSNKPAAES